MFIKNLNFLGHLTFKPGGLMTTFFMIFFPILIYLGMWQIDRGFEKQEVWKTYEERKVMVPFEELEFERKPLEELWYRTIILKGKFKLKSYILDNRIYRNKKGYEIFTLFETVQGKNILINRGWADEDALSKIYEEKLSTNPVIIQGIISPFNRFGLNLQEEPKTESWPKKVQELTFDQAFTDLKKYGLNNSIVHLSAASNRALEPIWKPYQFKSSRHFGYALQWFGLSLVLIISFIYFGVKKKYEN